MANISNLEAARNVLNTYSNTFNTTQDEGFKQVYAQLAELVREVSPKRVQKNYSPLEVFRVNAKEIQARLDEVLRADKATKSEDLYVLLGETIAPMTLQDFKISIGHAVKAGLVVGLYSVRGAGGGFYKTMKDAPVAAE